MGTSVIQAYVLRACILPGTVPGFQGILLGETDKNPVPYPLKLTF